MDSSKYLINEDPVFFLPSLAVGIGLNESILLQKIHGWLQCTPKEHIGRNWIYNSYKSWHEQLPFMSETTIKRTIKNLIDKKIILVENFNKNSFDKTLWYSIDYEKLNEIVETVDSVKMDYRGGQNDLTIVSKWTDNTNNNYNNIHNNKEIYKESFEQVWKLYPNKKGKENAYKSFIKAMKDGVLVEDITKGIERYCDYIETKGVQPQFIKHGSTWFNQKCWQDEYDTEKEDVPKWFNNYNDLTTSSDSDDEDWEELLDGLHNDS